MHLTHFGRAMSATLLMCALAAGAFLRPGSSSAASDPIQAPTPASSVCPAPVSADLSLRLDRISRKLARLEPIRILAIGSSSTEGIGASSAARSYPSRLEADLRLRWPKISVTVVNAGIGGETVLATVGRLERLLRTEAFDLVIWQLGTNDAVHGDDTDTFRKLTLRGIAAVRAAGADLVLLDPQYFPGIKDLARYERFVSIVRELGNREHVPVFGRYAMMKDWQGRGDAVLLGTLAADRFHMNDIGYGCLAEALAADLGGMAEPPALSTVPGIAFSAKK